MNSARSDKMKTMQELIATKHISALYRLQEMPRDEATKFIEENPEDVHDLLILVTNWINDGWMKRYQRTVK